MLKLLIRVGLTVALLTVLLVGALSVDGGASAPTWTHCGTPAAEADCPTTTTAPATTTVPATTTTTAPKPVPPAPPAAPPTPVRVAPRTAG